MVQGRQRAREGRVAGVIRDNHWSEDRLDDMTATGVRRDGQWSEE